MLHGNLAETRPVCFVVSTGRTGTKFLESFFGDVVGDVHCLHEPRPDLFETGVALHRGKLSEERAIRTLRKSRLPMLIETKKRGKALYMESNPNASLLLPQIKKAFPHYRVLWITRDIETYLPSAYNKSPDDSGSMFFYADDDHRKRLTAEDVANDPWHAAWKGFSRAERIAWWWQKCNSLLIDQTKGDGRCLHVKFEDLVDPRSGPTEIARITGFLGLDGRKTVEGEKILQALAQPKNQTRHAAAAVLDDQSATSRIRALTRDVRAKLGYQTSLA